jgi:hypothetical protein
MIKDIFKIIAIMGLVLLAISIFIAITASLCLLAEHLSSQSTIVTDLIEIVIISLCVIGFLHIIERMSNA